MNELYVGLMSGTSLDGVDAALVEFGGDAERPDMARLIAFRTDPYELDLPSRLSAAVSGRDGSAELCDLGFDLGERFAASALALLDQAGVDPAAVAAIGSHGQTVWHRPPAGREPGATLQLGESAVIAERTGIDVVDDFRVRDVAAGGHGAPLTPLFDLLVLSDPQRSRAIQNIGGMANVTGLPSEAAATGPRAFDTGPGVALIDEAAHRLTDGELAYDEDGRLAARGVVLESALEPWLSDPFFAETPPRSTGRERFGGPALAPWLDARAGVPKENLLATLTELSARTIADSYRFLGFRPDEVLLCGGGARNPELVRRLRGHLKGMRVRPLDDIGWNGDAREAAAFALLARQHRLGIRSDLSWATGAVGPRLLGKRTPA